MSVALKIKKSYTKIRDQFVMQKPPELPELPTLDDVFKGSLPLLVPPPRALSTLDLPPVPTLPSSTLDSDKLPPSLSTETSPSQATPAAARSIWELYNIIDPMVDLFGFWLVQASITCTYKDLQTARRVARKDILAYHQGRQAQAYKAAAKRQRKQSGGKTTLKRLLLDTAQLQSHNDSETVSSTQRNGGNKLEHKPIWRMKPMMVDISLPKKDILWVEKQRVKEMMCRSVRYCHSKAGLVFMAECRDLFLYDALLSELLYVWERNPDDLNDPEKPRVRDQVRMRILNMADEPRIMRAMEFLDAFFDENGVMAGNTGERSHDGWDDDVLKMMDKLGLHPVLLISD